jgi:hypothetical protein
VGLVVRKDVLSLSYAVSSEMANVALQRLAVFCVITKTYRNKPELMPTCKFDLHRRLCFLIKPLRQSRTRRRDLETTALANQKSIYACVRSWRV